jgi:dienelactone hydrolase
MARTLRFALGCLLLLSCTGPQRTGPAPDAPVESRLRAGAWKPLDVQVESRHEAARFTVEELSFRGVAGERVKATRVRPPGGGPFPGVLYVHWLGDVGSSNRTEFLAEAEELAGLGIVSLLVDALWSQKDYYEARVPEADFEASIAQTRDLVRALSLLSAEPGVDGARLAVVGHDYGAMHAILVGAIEHRPRAWVLMTPTPHFSDWAFYGPVPKDREAYLKRMAELDPLAFIGQLTGAVLLQFASRDAFVPAASAAALDAAAPPGHTTRTYEADHALAVPAARAERLAFLRSALLVP